MPTWFYLETRVLGKTAWVGIGPSGGPPIAYVPEDAAKLLTQAHNTDRETLAGYIDTLAAASVAAWTALGYQPGDAPAYDLAEAIRLRLAERQTAATRRERKRRPR